MKMFCRTQSFIVVVIIAAAQGAAGSAYAQQPAEISECARAREDPVFLTDRYSALVCAGEDSLKKGELDKARTQFIGALRETLVEVPNYAPILKLAEVECLRNATDDGIHLLQEFSCMLDIEIGRRQCFSDKGSNARNEIISDSVSYMCFQRMCSELYLSYYEAPTPATHEWVADMRGEVDRVRNICDAKSGR